MKRKNETDVDSFNTLRLASAFTTTRYIIAMRKQFQGTNPDCAVFSSGCTSRYEKGIYIGYGRHYHYQWKAY